ncbi:MAG TPA: type II 3-dehydroquinate dehydratase [Bacteroidales bacterium]|jgi:3-dehydroquinate dehydratase II|nr:3-dehydroquinate dehydratase [Bacteroidales bacterium]MDD4394511.1 3-dehydroquinate dehydratase [Bacteroidales bacterium]HNW67556.1 type II 3-dehydroquinate dehydratase [Bacteroidales bacterium]HPT52310.1 type II 3-dehydroquinate dehydratase [Bacteroidales bacterium]
MKRLLILNGINLDRLGTREIDIYGTISFQDYFVELQKKFSDVELVSFQSDRLDDITDKLLKSENFDGIILNAGAYTHSSLVLADTIKSISTRVVEVHISNLFGREQYRKNSHLAGVCSGFISGFGLKGYDLAILSFIY